MNATSPPPAGPPPPNITAADHSGGDGRRPERVTLELLPRILAAACAIEDGDPSYAHAILLDLELDLEAWREAA